MRQRDPESEVMRRLGSKPPCSTAARTHAVSLDFDGETAGTREASVFPAGFGDEKKMPGAVGSGLSRS